MRTNEGTNMDMYVYDPFFMLFTVMVTAAGITGAVMLIMSVLPLDAPRDLWLLEKAYYRRGGLALFAAAVLAFVALAAYLPGIGPEWSAWQAVAIAAVLTFALAWWITYGLPNAWVAACEFREARRRHALSESDGKPRLPK